MNIMYTPVECQQRGIFGIGSRLGPISTIAATGSHKRETYLGAADIPLARCDDKAGAQQQTEHGCVNGMAQQAVGPERTSWWSGVRAASKRKWRPSARVAVQDKRLARQGTRSSRRSARRTAIWSKTRLATRGRRRCIRGRDPSGRSDLFNPGFWNSSRSGGTEGTR
jgi:hypothetical protein